MKKQRGYALLLTLGIATLALTGTILASTENQTQMNVKERDLTVEYSALAFSRFVEANMEAASSVGWMPEGRVTVDQLRERNSSLPGFDSILGGQDLVAYYAVAQNEPKRVDLLITTEGQASGALLAKYGWEANFSDYIRRVSDSEGLRFTAYGEPVKAVAGEIDGYTLQGSAGQDIDLSAFSSYLDRSEKRFGVFVKAPNQLVEWTFLTNLTDYGSYEPKATGDLSGSVIVQYASRPPMLQNLGGRALCGKALDSIGIDQTTDWVELPSGSRGLCLESLAGHVDSDLQAKTSFQFLTTHSAIDGTSPAPLGNNPSLRGRRCYPLEADYSSYPLRASAHCFDGQIRTFVNPYSVEGLIERHADSEQLASNAGLAGSYDSEHFRQIVSTAETKRYVINDFVSAKYLANLCGQDISGAGKIWIGVMECGPGIDYRSDFVIPAFIVVNTIAKDLGNGRYLYVYTVSGQITTSTGTEGIHASGYKVGERGTSSKVVPISYETGNGPAEIDLRIYFQNQ
ncbi:hypothetical protein [Salinicola aestuarinus]|uniref:hypothetical protein n=1 Tax=Salinicola aestuarinus TaxID=1949082 RepID=UPI001300954E|nr:hypothetical protein [Salinicola aestuarinus]